MCERIERLNGGEPILTPAMFQAAGAPQEGTNLNGPSPVALPDWLPVDRRADPAARYYLYFAHHGGLFIRMAWAAHVEGPYRLFNLEPPADAPDAPAGASDVPPGRGVLDLTLGEDAQSLRFDNGVEVRGHIASPDVHLDHANRRFILYFHGPTNTTAGPPPGFTGPQKSLVATSATGLNFNPPALGGERGHGPRPALLGNAYFRVFEYAGFLYAFSNGGGMWRAPVDRAWQPADPPTADGWEPGPNPVLDGIHAAGRDGVDPRHFAVRFVDDDRLEVFYTGRRDAPEAIERTTIDLSAGGGDWRAWRTDRPHERIMAPQLAWEGVNEPITPSRPGAQTNVHQLRDPGLLQDADGSVYLFYCGGGEDAIGVGIADF